MTVALTYHMPSSSLDMLIPRVTQALRISASMVFGLLALVLMLNFCSMAVSRANHSFESSSKYSVAQVRAACLGTRPASTRRLPQPVLAHGTRRCNGPGSLLGASVSAVVRGMPEKLEAQGAGSPGTRPCNSPQCHEHGGAGGTGARTQLGKAGPRSAVRADC